VEMNWSTFVLEIINFLVLVWILKRFFYKPVLEVIARRKAGIEKTLAEAKTFRAEAEKLREQYQSRVAEEEQERQMARETLSREIEAERARRMAELQTVLAQEREKIRVAEERRKLDAMRKMEETALVHGARFATCLLKETAGRETEARLAELVVAELDQLPAERLAALRGSDGMSREEAVVASAFPLSDDLRLRLRQSLATIAGREVRLRFEQNSELLAGLEITLGAWVLGANIRDELKGFVALAHDA